MKFTVKHNRSHIAEIATDICRTRYSFYQHYRCSKRCPRSKHVKHARIRRHNLPRCICSRLWKLDSPGFHTIPSFDIPRPSINLLAPNPNAQTQFETQRAARARRVVCLILISTASPTPLPLYCPYNSPATLCVLMTRSADGARLLASA